MLMLVAAALLVPLGQHQPQSPPRSVLSAACNLNGQQLA